METQLALLQAQWVEQQKILSTDTGHKSALLRAQITRLETHLPEAKIKLAGTEKAKADLENRLESLSRQITADLGNDCCGIEL